MEAWDNKHRFGLFWVLDTFDVYILENLKIVKFYSIKLAADLRWQPSYLLSETSLLSKASQVM